MPLRAFIQHNFWLKMLSLALAVVIWIAIKFGKQESVPQQNLYINPMVQESKPVAVNVMTHPGDARVFRVEPPKVIVTLTAEAAVLAEVSPKDFKAFIDLTDVRSPESNKTVRLYIPAGVTILKVEPRGVSVEPVSP